MGLKLRSRVVFSGVALALALSGHAAQALCDTDALCLGDPCVIPFGSHAIDNLCTLDFGSRAVELEGTLDLALAGGGAGSMTLLGGSFEITSGPALDGGHAAA